MHQGRGQRSTKRARAGHAAESSAGESADAAAVKTLVDAQAQTAEAAKALMARTNAKAQQVRDLSSQLRREQEQTRQLRTAVQEQIDAREALASRYQASAASAKASYTASLKAVSARHDRTFKLKSAEAERAERALLSHLPHFDGQGCVRHCMTTTAEEPHAGCACASAVDGAVADLSRCDNCRYVRNAAKTLPDDDPRCARLKV